MVCLHHDHIGPSANTAHTDNDFSSLTFLIDNGCMGGSLLTTTGAHILLHDRQFTDSVIRSATNDVPAQYVGSLPFAGRTYFEMNRQNLLSLDEICQTHNLDYIKQNNQLIIFDPLTNNKLVVAHRQEHGKYLVTYKQLIEADRLLQSLRRKSSHLMMPATITTHRHHQLEAVSKQYSAAELARATEAHVFHRNQGHPSDEQLIKALDQGNIYSTNLTSQDIRNMRNIFGPCQACFEGKATMPSPQAGATITTAPGQLLHADLKEYAATTIGGNRWALVTVDDYTGFIQVVSIKNKSTASVLAGLKCVIRFYNQFRHVVVAIQVDPEKTLLACQPGLSETR